MRMELELRKAAGEEAVQKLSAQGAEESRQMQAGVQALREELERERARHAEAEQTDRRNHRDVVKEFEKTIQEIRGSLEASHAKK
jgi:hypothetical protein